MAAYSRRLRQPEFPETGVLGDLRRRSEAWSMSALYKRMASDVDVLVALENVSAIEKSTTKLLSV